MSAFVSFSKLEYVHLHIPEFILVLKMAFWRSKKRKKNRYRRIAQLNASTEDLMYELKVRTSHHSNESMRIAQRNIRASTSLKILTLILSAYVTMQLTLNNNSLTENTYLIWSTTICSFLVAIFSTLQIFLFDDKASAKLLHVSQEFYEIKQQVKILEIANKDIKNKDILADEYKKLMKIYLDKRSKYLEHIDSHKKYYGLMFGARQVAEIDSLDLAAIDRA